MSETLTIDREDIFASLAPMDDEGDDYEGDEFDPADPFCYGWRDVVRTLPNGERIFDRIPLTLEDILHPKLGDVHVHTDEHERIRLYLCNALNALLEDRPGAIVLTDTRVAWGHRRIRPHSPDIAVVFDVRQRRDWSTFDCRRERTRPTLIIEITSPGTRSVDLDRKFEQYEQVGVQFYVIVDLRRTERGIERRLFGWRLTLDGYAPLSLNEDGWLWLEPVEAWLAIKNDRVLCYTQAIERLDEYVEVLRAKRAAEARARAAEREAHEAERQAFEARRQAQEANRNAQETSRQLQEANRQAQEANRLAQDAHRLAVEEARQRAEAEERVLRLEEELRALKAQRHE
jgi:Uma2 family endonuclease